MTYKLSLNRSYTRNKIVSDIIDNLSDTRFTDPDVDAEVANIYKASNSRINKVINEVINGQAKCISYCILHGEDIKLDWIGSFKQKKYRKIFIKHEEEIIKELNLKLGDLKDEDIRLKVTTMAKERSSKEYKTKNIKYSVPVVVNIDFTKCLKKHNK